MSDQKETSVQQELPLTPWGEVDAEEAILQRWNDPAEEEEQVSDQVEEATAEQVEETDEEQLIEEEEELEQEEPEEDDLEEEAEEEPEEDEQEEDVETELSDETLVEIVVDGETQQASIAALKRLYGQEKSLTRKSQETARLRKEAETSIEKSHIVLQKMIEQAQERAKPYEEVDMMLASKQLSDADFAQLRKEAKEATDTVKFLTEEADAFYGELQKQQQATMQQQAKECVQVLQQDIPEWSNNLYNDIRAYAVSQGLPQEQVDTYVDPSVIKILHKARLYDEGKKVATSKKKAPAKRVLKSKKSPPNAQQIKSQNTAKLAKKVRSSTDIDDMADLIMSRWQN